MGRYSHLFDQFEGSTATEEVNVDTPSETKSSEFSHLFDQFESQPAYTGADKYLNEDNLIQTGMEMIDETNREVPALFTPKEGARPEEQALIDYKRYEDVTDMPKELIKGVSRGGLRALGSVGDMMQWAFEKKESPPLSKDATPEQKEFDALMNPKYKQFAVDKMMGNFRNGLVNLGKTVSDFWNKKADEMSTEELLRASWTERPLSKAMATVGEGLPLYGLAIASSVVTKSPIFAGTIFGAVEGSSTYVKARESGEVSSKANLLALLNGAWTSVSEAVPFEMMLGNAGKNLITRIAKGGSTEAIQELVQTVGSNIIEKVGFDKGRDIWEGWIESIVGGGVLGAGGGAVIQGGDAETGLKTTDKKAEEPIKEKKVKEESKVEPIKEDPISDKKSEKKVTFEEKLKESNEELKTAGNEVSSKIQTEIDRVKNKIKEGKQPKAKVKPTPKGGVKSFDDLEVEKAPTKEPVKQDLKEEAKKFKSAEEFVESQDIIRNTDVNLDEKKSLLKSGDEIDDIGEFTDNFQDELKKFGFKNIEELRSNIEASESILEKEVLKEQQLTDIYNEAHKEPASVKEKVEPKEKVETEEITTTKKDSGDVGIVSGSINNLIGGQKVAEVDLKGNVTEVTKDVSDLEVEVLRLEGLQSKGKLTREELRKSLFGKVLSGSELDMFDNVDKSFKLIQDKVASLSKTKVEPKEKERGFAKSLEDAGLVKGEDDFYKSITNEDTIIQANARIEKSEQGAIQYVLEETESDSAEKTTTAIGLVAKLQKDAENIKSSNPQEYEAKMSQAVEIATKLTQRLTKAGQIVQSASLLSKLSPDGVLVWATKKIDDINKKKPKKGIFAKKQELTTKQVEQFRDIAKKLQESEGFSQQAKDITKLTDKVFKGEKLSNEDLGQIKGFVDEIVEKSGLKEDIGVSKKVRKQSETSKILTERLTKAESDARARIESRRTKKPISKIKSRKGGAISTLPIQDIVDYSIIGASKIGKVGVSFAEWSRSMVKDMGDIATNDLQKIYNRSKNLFNQEKAKSRKINQQAKQLKNLIEKAYSSKGGDQYTSEALSSMADELKNLTGQIKIEKAQELAHAVNALENSSLLKKIATLQTMGHLLNPKTNVRNILGNELFWRLERLNKYGATGIDWTRSELTGSERTVTYKSGNQFNYWSSLLHGIRMGWKGMSAGGLTTQFDLKGQTFKGVFNPLTYMEKALSASLRGFDYAAYNRAVYQTFGEMAELDIINNKRKFKNSKLKQAWINNYVSNVDEATQEIADQAGKYVTFQDENIISTTFSKIKQVLNLGKEFGLGDIVLKYPKTPGNLLARAIDYSPIGIVRGLKIMTDPYRTNADPNPREATLAISRAITGATGLTALGVYLISKGLLTGDDDKDWKVRKLKREQLGESSYQVNLSMFKRWIGSGFKDSALGKRDGDLLYSYDWMQPIAINLAMAANLEKELSNTKGIDEKVLGIAKAGGEAFFKSFKVLEEQPLLRGIRDLFKGYGSVSENLFKVAVGIPSSFVPTFLNQIRQSLSNEARDTWSPNPWQRAINRAMLKIPVISNNLPLAFKSLGEKVPREVYNSDGNTLWNVFLNPGFVAKYKVDPVTQMLLDPYKEEGRKRQIPKIAKRKLKIDGVDYNLEGKDVAKMQMIMANTLSKILRKSKLADNKAMKLLTPEMQEKLLAKLVNASSEIGKRWFIDNRLEDYKGSNDV